MFPPTTAKGLWPVWAELIALMPYKLRYLSKEYLIASPGLRLGRDPRCDVVLDDAMVSRAHAVVIHDAQGLRLDDLDSRNGVYVNGKRAAAVEALRSGDVLTIGKQLLYLLESQAVLPGPEGPFLRHTLPQIDVADLFVDGDVEPSMRTHAVGALLAPDDATSVRRLELLRLLGEVAEKSVALGRPADAERVLTHVLEEVRRGLARGKPTDADLLLHAVRRALFLAVACNKGVWLRYVLDVYLASGMVPPVQVVEEISTMWTPLGRGHEAALDALVRTLQQGHQTLGPSEHFTLGRLDALRQRVVPAAHT